VSHIKEAVIRLVQSLPDDCTVEDIQYHLYIREKVEGGLQAIEEGRVVSEEEADQRIEEWLSLSGPNQP
jgi:predicted transcriptional regulator